MAPMTTRMRKPTMIRLCLSVLLLGALSFRPCTAAAFTAPAAGPLQASSPQAPDATRPGTTEDDEKLSLSDQIIQQVLEPLRTGMETQNAQQVLSIFDKREVSGYSDLQGQLHAFFRQFAEVRFRYQILQATEQGDRASATAEMQMDASPYQATQITTRRSAQMRMQLKLESKGWKIIGFSPADFFSLDYSRNESR